MQILCKLILIEGVNKELIQLDTHGLYKLLWTKGEIFITLTIVDVKLIALAELRSSRATSDFF